MWRATGLQLIKRKSIEAPERRRVFFFLFFFAILSCSRLLKCLAAGSGSRLPHIQRFVCYFSPPPLFFYYLSRGEQQTRRAGFYLDWNLLAYIPSWWQGLLCLPSTERKRKTFESESTNIWNGNWVLITIIVKKRDVNEINCRIFPRNSRCWNNKATEGIEFYWIPVRERHEGLSFRGKLGLGALMACNLFIVSHQCGAVAAGKRRGSRERLRHQPRVAVFINITPVALLLLPAHHHRLHIQTIFVRVCFFSLFLSLFPPCTHGSKRFLK